MDIVCAPPKLHELWVICKPIVFQNLRIMEVNVPCEEHTNVLLYTAHCQDGAWPSCISPYKGRCMVAGSFTRLSYCVAIRPCSHVYEGRCAVWHLSISINYILAIILNTDVLTKQGFDTDLLTTN